jgi:ornithine cyclodeaminase
MTGLPYFDAAAVRAAAQWTTAVAALESALLNGVDPEEDSPRLFSPAPGGEFLLMPAAGGTYSGVKALTVAPGNPARGLEKIQGVYLLVDSDTLAPLAVMDGTELTAIRTPATTLLAVTHILEAAPEAQVQRVLVFGAGVQALNHVRAAHALLPGVSFAVVGRRSERTRDLIATLAEEGIDVSEGSVADVPGADVVLCTTTSTTPLFDGGLVAPHAVVAAVGQHGLDAREVDATLVRRSDVVVEGRASALREAGDLIPARSVEEWRELRPTNLRELVRGEFTRTPGRPCLYSGVGMAWEDLVSAALVYERGTRE